MISKQAVPMAIEKISLENRKLPGVTDVTGENTTGAVHDREKCSDRREVQHLQDERCLEKVRNIL